MGTEILSNLVPLMRQVQLLTSLEETGCVDCMDRSVVDGTDSIQHHRRRSRIEIFPVISKIASCNCYFFQIRICPKVALDYCVC